MTPEQIKRQQELSQIEDFVRRKPHLVYKAERGEISGWDYLPLREKRLRCQRKTFKGLRNVPTYAPVRAR